MLQLTLESAFSNTLSVSELNLYVKNTLENDLILKRASIKGEISNCILHRSGHIYFTLKDEEGAIDCVMFKGDARLLNFIPKDGIKVIVTGKVSIYAKTGKYQVYCNSMEKEGIGELYIKFEKLKEKLEKEGLFDELKKKKIPRYAKNIGIITSPTGAALTDIIKVTRLRNRSVNLLIYPASVQGENAPSEIINGISKLNNHKDIDLIILARGGGAIEDLWCFNDESLARAIFKSEKPIVTGIGHEIDFTIADFVSDLRAATPSNAAEISVFNEFELISKLKNLEKNLSTKILTDISKKAYEVDFLYSKFEKNSPNSKIEKQKAILERYNALITHEIKNKFAYELKRFEKAHSLLNAYNPLNVLNKGYTIIQNPDGRIISSKELLKSKKELKIIFKDGIVDVNITLKDRVR
ncbi:exodeoxyribonuclease VII, large subunit [Methanococcus vannielii SB]|uniref:Exodeoxyribonuclease VII, large subunit n=1 Tax=Methanococcus vannielii (strain ATCC 35089 / DSM 1224 / JCM 13029 / OCM 148 / SB) TaxID=406327 RepID=A6USM3_METVS|nr:exodeoxyribonuclease VII large subunit [Methanococcus vannielii]ABR55495.1 exodeoxyribonuclease VII, large subunit [Methanococcus vannielii SB]